MLEMERRVAPRLAARSAESRLNWYNLALLFVLLVTLGLHISLIHYPDQPIFDETYYVEEARSILAGNGDLRPEHPPLGKLLFAGGMALFGDNAVGWRLLPALFGTGSILVFYLLCRQLKLSRKGAFFATFLLAFDVMTFTQAAVAMLDVYSVFFMLLAFLFYLRRSYALSGAAIALSILAKMSGIMALVAILLHWLIVRRKEKRAFIASMAAIPAIFIGLIVPLQYAIAGRFVNPVEQIKLIMSLSGSLTFANTSHPAASHPWDWVLRPLIMPYWYDPHYLSVTSYTLWLVIIPVVVFLVWRARKRDSAAVFGLSWFAATYFLWIPLSLATNRISYVFYFYPTVGAVCLGLALMVPYLARWGRELFQGRLKEALTPAVGAYCALHIAIFCVLSPLFSPIITLKLW